MCLAYGCESASRHLYPDGDSFPNFPNETQSVYGYVWLKGSRTRFYRSKPQNANSGIYTNVSDCW